jgi:hypothetical protein
MTDWRKAQRKAAHTAKWAITMTKQRITRLVAKTKWHLVTFVGPNGGESVGIVDLLAIRKAHNHAPDGLKRGDMFNIILIQVKGGGAALPTEDEMSRLRRVARRYGAQVVLLAVWRRGKQVDLFRLKRPSRFPRHPRDAWSRVEAPYSLFH